MGEAKGECDWERINFDEIELGEVIGGGGVGLVYSGRLRGKPVALKTLFDSRVSDELRQEYLDELFVLSRVRHSNIVPFLGASLLPPHIFFVMELCQGITSFQRPF
jgi:serine/threonine protein kinase